MNTPQPWLGWWKLKALLATQIDHLLAAAGFWQMGYFPQLFVVGLLLGAGGVLCLGPLIVTAFRTMRSGDRPGVPSLVLVVLSVPCAVMLMPLLGRLLQHVLERNPGPII